MFEFEEEHTRGWLNDTPLVSDSNRDKTDPLLKRKLFLGFNKKLTEEKLTDHFKRFGVIEKLIYLRDGFGASRGSAFIIFSEEKGAENALLNKPHVIGLNNSIEIRYAYPKDFNNSNQRVNQFPDKIFIGGLPKNVTKNDIMSFFKKCYGNSLLFGIKDIILPSDSLGRAKGFASVQFNNEDLVDRIIFEKNRFEICGRMCEIKRAEMRDEDLVQKSAPEPAPPKLKLNVTKSENINIVNPTVSISTLSSTTTTTEKPKALRLIKSCEERKKESIMTPAPLTNITNKEPIPVPEKTTVPLLKITPPVKRSTSNPMFNEIKVEKECEKISSKLDNETLIEIGRVFVDMISSSITENKSLNTNSSMTSFVLSTVQKILMNVRKN